jgi:diguanylate cyclase (GGDEF)-like protein
MRSWVLAGGAALLGAAFLGVLQVPGLGGSALTVLSDGGQLVAAVLASIGCAVASRRTSGRRRRAWAWLSVGTGAWAAGQAVWGFYEVALGRDVPFPSVADVGFVAFPLAAATGLLIWLGAQGDELVARGRDVLDGAIIAGSLLVLSWVTTLGSVVAAGGDPASLALALAYPVGDIILATLVLLALARGAASERATLVVLALGLGGLATADSAYVYLTGLKEYSSADLVTGGWVVGFLLVAAAGWGVPRSAPEAAAYTRPAPARAPRSRRTMLRLALPYVPLVAAMIVLCTSLLRAPRTPTIDLLLGIAVVIIVLGRQFLALMDNQRLLTELAEVHDQLHHRALHDALTGLPNRVLFADRLDRALLQPDAEVSVLFCDLDDFKLVNDELGHEAGDQLLQRVAQRLVECVRVTDTVARLGGDEFAVLLEHSHDAVQVAERIVEAFAEDHGDIAGRPVRTSISVGISHHLGGPTGSDVRRGRGGPAGTTDRADSARRLLRQADTAMYAAKGAGKGRAVLAEQNEALEAS